MKYSLPIAACLLLLFSCFAEAQSRQGGGKQRGGPTPNDIGENPQDIGDAGVAWYTTWETGLAEAKRSNRPIFFMSAATTCAGGVSGVFWPGYTDTQNSLFSTEKFIDVSRKFVCVRIETYESKQSEEMVRKLLSGRFENTAFCIFDPSGTQRLSKTGRSPGQGLGAGRPGKGSANKVVIDRMEQIASTFAPIGEITDTELQDFHSFRQALNVASADQRLLLFVNVDEKSRSKVNSNLQKVFTDEEVMGRFHLDFADAKTDGQWGKSIKGATDNAGMAIIRSGQFGMDGSVIKQLSLETKPEEIKAALLSANESFAMLEERKGYSDHVRQGRRQQIYFENAIPYGEDKDGDGEPDTKNRKRGGGGRK